MVTVPKQATVSKLDTGHPKDSESVVRLVSYSAAACYLGVSYWTVRTMVLSGEIPHIRAGRRVLVDVRDLDRWIEDNKQF
jgi:excisionase family DNA binding protein